MRLALLVLSTILCLSARAETPTNTDKDSDDAIVAAAEKLVNESAKPATASTTGATAPVTATAPEAAASPTRVTEAQINQDMKKESEIPIFGKSDKLTKSEGSLIWRLVASLAFIAVVGGAMIIVGKRFKSQKNKGGEKARIEILHQFHMGPKKSVALIRVAGEALLIGCTDHSINLLKTVALIDDEMEGALGGDFNAFLEDEFSAEDMRTALSPRPRA